MNNWTERLGPAKIKRPTSKRFSKISYFLELVKKKKILLSRGVTLLLLTYVMSYMQLVILFTAQPLIF